MDIVAQLRLTEVFKHIINIGYTEIGIFDESIRFERTAADGKVESLRLFHDVGELSGPFSDPATHERQVNVNDFTNPVVQDRLISGLS